MINKAKEKAKFYKCVSDTIERIRREIKYCMEDIQYCQDKYNDDPNDYYNDRIEDIQADIAALNELKARLEKF